MSILIKDTTREEREKIVEESIGAISSSCENCMPGLAEMYQDYIDGMRSDLEFLGAVAKEHGILLAVTETGQEGQSFAEWWTKELQAAIDGYPVCYFLTWRNAWDPEHPAHWFSSFPGATSEDDFKKFYNSDKTLFLNDLK